MSKDNTPRAGDAYRQAIRDLSKVASPKGIGNTDFGQLHEIEVTISPSIICAAYTTELYDAMVATICLSSGNPNASLPFTESDLYVYLTILLRERIRDVRKQRVLFRSSDSDIKVPHFFYLALYELGDVVDEQRHIWLKTLFDDSELIEAHDGWSSTFKVDETTQKIVVDVAARQQWKATYQLYEGEATEREFVYSMSRSLKLLERWGFVNGEGLPRGLTGDVSFMLFMWMEGKLQHPDPDVEPGQALLASLLAFTRSTTLLNPYIGYGPEAAYRVLLKEVTLPRGKQTP
jgi:hypothetical protein